MSLTDYIKKMVKACEDAGIKTSLHTNEFDALDEVKDDKKKKK